MTRDDIPPVIRQELATASRQFFAQYADVDRDEIVAKVEWALVEFMNDVHVWRTDLPKAEGDNVGKGRPQTTPSQRASQVIPEVEQLHQFLLDNPRWGFFARLRMTALHRRPRLSKYAAQILAGLRFVGSGVLFDYEEPRGFIANRGPDALQPWGDAPVSLDNRRIKRAFARRAAEYRLTYLKWRSAGVTPSEELRRILLGLSNRGAQHFRIGHLIGALTPGLRVRLMQTAGAAVERLRILFALPDNVKGAGRLQPLAYFDRQAPIYALGARLLNMALRWSDIQEERQRALDIEGAAELPENLGRLIGRVVTAAVKIAARQNDRWIGVGGFKPFIGVWVNQIGKGIAEPEVEPGLHLLTARIARALLEKREQAIVLADHAMTMWRWLDQIDRRGGVMKGDRPSLGVLSGLAYHRLLDWAEETEAQLNEGILFASDFGRRDAGTPLRFPNLTTTALRGRYPIAFYRNRRFADVPPAAILELLEVLYRDEPAQFVRVREARNALLGGELAVGEALR